jgi:hypothetical protein
VGPHGQVKESVLPAGVRVPEKGSHQAAARAAGTAGVDTWRDGRTGKAPQRVAGDQDSDGAARTEVVLQLQAPPVRRGDEGEELPVGVQGQPGAPRWGPSA